jgi:FKBP-type peptidyl-prolyl cis-trans isomerase (trigger factor)
MNLTTNTRPDGVMILKATVAEADYATEVEKSLREMRRKANVPGFRPGMVPMGMINKMYRKSVVAEQAYRKANAEVFKHLEENKISIMGDVMPSDEQGDLNFDGSVTEHEFVFEAAPAPEVKVSVDNGDKLTSYKIKPSKEMTEPKGDQPAPSAEQIEAALARESEWLFATQFKNILLAKANVQLPEKFLKNWLFAVNEGKFTMEQIEAELPAFLRMMAWDLVQKHFVTTLGIEVSQDDLMAEAKTLARMQFAQYGMGDVPDETIDNFAKSILATKEEAQRLYERVRENKILEALRPMVKVSEKSVSLEEFQKVATESMATPAQ